MPRKFTLANLMLGITLLGVYGGLAVSKDECVAAYAYIMATFIPAVLIGFVVASFLENRMSFLVVTLIGAMIGGCSGIPHQRGPRTVWESWPLFVSMAISATIGAAIVGGLMLALYYPPSYKPPSDDKFEPRA
jgi:hypothetical protein